MLFILGRLASTRLLLFIGQDDIIQHVVPSSRLNSCFPSAGSVSSDNTILCHTVCVQNP